MPHHRRTRYRRMNPKQLTDNQKLLRSQMRQAQLLVEIFTRGLAKQLECYEYDSIEDYETLEKFVQGDLKNAVYLADSTKKAYYDSIDNQPVRVKVGVGKVRTKKKAK